MTLKRKKVYLVAIGVGGMALLVDRFLLAESATAPGAAEAATGVLALQPPDNGKQRKVPIPAVPFPVNIPPFDAARELRDIFKQPGVDLAGQNDQNERSGGPKTNGADGFQSPKEFALGHSLEAVFSEADLQVAVVDGQWVRVGASLDGCRLTAVHETQARFQCREGEVVLDISDVAVRMRD